MRLTIIADDKTVGVDGKFYLDIDLTKLDATIHAVQWYGEYGEVEYKTQFQNGAIVKPANLLFTDITPYQFAIDGWNARTALILEQKQLAQKAFILKQEQLQANTTNTTNTQNPV
jgi:hypothetical protein